MRAMHVRKENTNKGNREVLRSRSRSQPAHMTKVVAVSIQATSPASKSASFCQQMSRPAAGLVRFVLMQLYVSWKIGSTVSNFSAVASKALVS
jgi:hypothetical protein